MKFVKYLPEFGVTPVIITTDIQSFREVIDGPIDASLLDELPSDLRVERIPCSPSEKKKGRLGTWRRTFFSLVEPQAKWWKPQLERHLPRLFEVYKPEAIYVSLPPFGMGPLWCDLAEKFRLPLILDFRDAWSQFTVSPYASWVHYYLTLRLERRCLLAAHRIVCRSDQIREDLLMLHRGIPKEKLVTITSGYDGEINGGSLLTNKPVKAEEFVIGHVGNFYYTPSAHEAMMLPWWRKKPHRMIQYVPRKQDWLYRTPYFFFRTIALLLKNRPELRDRLRIRFAGHKPEWMDAQVDRFGLEGLVEFVGYLDHKNVLNFQSQCDCLLVTSSKVLGGIDYSIPGKTFEYFSLRKPILGFVQEGAQKEILRKSGLAVFCDPDDTEGSVSRLLDLIDGRIILSANRNFLQGLHNRELTKTLAGVFLKLKVDVKGTALSGS
jgi:glycosyltransferase involved in cell wall biosynthesis